LKTVKKKTDIILQMPWWRGAVGSASTARPGFEYLPGFKFFGNRQCCCALLTLYALFACLPLMRNKGLSHEKHNFETMYLLDQAQVRFQDPVHENQTEERSDFETLNHRNKNTDICT
jgi:hypothetical protein